MLMPLASWLLQLAAVGLLAAAGGCCWPPGYCMWLHSASWLLHVAALGLLAAAGD